MTPQTTIRVRAVPQVAQMAFAVVLAAALLLNGCTVLGPDFTEPAVPWLEKWKSDLYGQAGKGRASAAEDLEFWWHLFESPHERQHLYTCGSQ